MPRTDQLPPIHRIARSALPRPSAPRVWPLRLFVLALVLACAGLLMLIRMLIDIVADAQHLARAV